MNTAAWTAECLRWQKYERETAHQANLAVLEAIQRDLAQPARLKRNFPSILAGVANLFNTHTDLETAAEICAALGAWPERWGFSAAWEKQLHQAANWACENNHPKSAILLETLAELLYFSSKTEEARKLAQQAVGQARLIRDPAALALGLKTLMAIHWSLDEPAEIDEQINACEAELLSWGISPDRILTYCVPLKIMQVMILRTTGEIALARDLAAQLIDNIFHLEEIDIHLVADCYQVCGVMGWVNGLLVEAQYSFERASELYALAGASTMLAYIQANLALVYLSRGRLKLAEQASINAIQLNEQVGSLIRYVNSLGLLGLTYYCARRFKESAAIFRRQIRLARRSGSNRSYHLAVDNRHSLLVMQGKFRKALPGLLEARAYYQQSNARERLLGVEIDLIVCFHGLEDTEQVEYYAQSIQTLLEKPGLERNRAAALRAISLARPTEEARNLLHTAYDLAVNRGFQLEKAACLLKLAGLESDPELRSYLWQAGSELCVDCGAGEWLTGATVDQPPFLPFVI